MTAPRSLAFDVIVVVDWSANNRPKLGADSIWICALDVASGRAATVNLATRSAASAHVVDILRAATARRVLVGWDFPFGFPAGTSAAAGLVGTSPWQAMWGHLATHVVDTASNLSNRFAVAADLNRRIGDGPGPFWGAPPTAVGPTLSSQKAPGFPHAHEGRGPGGEQDQQLGEHRLAEVAIRRQTGKRPFAVWQLLGAGSVGSQALTGIPVVATIRSAPGLAERSVVWPFETGLVPPGAHPVSGAADLVVHAEVWPSAIEIDRSVHPVKDAAQVQCLARHFSDLQRTSGLADEFAPVVTADHARSVVTEEGWILGATLVR